MFICDHKNLVLCFNDLKKMTNKDLPQYGEYCLLELKDGSLTAGDWHPSGNGKTKAGKFIRGTADTVSSEEVARWQSLDRYNLSNCLEEENIRYINMGLPREGGYKVEIKNFKSLKDRKFPKSEQFCLLILKNGNVAAGRWDQWKKNKDGTFIYAPALASYSMDEVWAWTPLSPDVFSIREEESENEEKREKELNRNPSTDPVKFKYGTDIGVYYEKALEKLRAEYPWATLVQMKKKQEWKIVPCHGKYVFGQVNESYPGKSFVTECENVSTADEFIDFLCEYAKESVVNSNPEVKFTYGLDINVYIDKAYENVKKDYRWFNREILKKCTKYAIKQVDGEWEFVSKWNSKDPYRVYDTPSADRFIENLEYEYQSAALRANPVVKVYAVKFGSIDLNGWWLERYEFSKLKTGDYKVSVQAGDRVTGGGRDFFITPYCFEAKTYEEFLDRYLEIVPGHSFGLYKEDLIHDAKLREFLGY